ncbi:hypothetical protein HW932_01760 [Allochromatium humboldtianum]|uniref:Uncharacterized protein n=1 Tax=Allochromatium humboldtianum TaxID=504901 RepID=A0A850R5B4_9GAMM|nr:hypothetical protein [Allochromatium humboldtianum]NVZ07985.1 hypothetical protein [Allochromatium humboldtianum]
MPSFTKTAYYSDYETTVSLDVEFDETFEIDPTEYVESCTKRECGELLDAIVSENNLHDVFQHADEDTLSTLAEALSVTRQAPPPSVPIPDLNLSSSDIARIPGHMLADNITWQQLLAILLTLPYGRRAALEEAWDKLAPYNKNELATALGLSTAPPRTEPVDDALELLSDVDRNRLLGLPDTTLDHLRTLLTEA